MPGFAPRLLVVAVAAVAGRQRAGNVEVSEPGVLVEPFQFHIGGHVARSAAKSRLRFGSPERVGADC